MARLVGRLFLLLMLTPVLLYAQTGTITGRVLNAVSKAPLAKVSVFLSNATYGTITAEDGTFKLTGVKPGQYELIMTSVGYEEYSQSVLVGAQPLQVNAELKTRVLQLEEVVFTNPGDFKRNYQMFLTEFLGTSSYAKQCKITNPDELKLIYRKSKKTLEASSYDFINIENRALGYRVKFLLKAFKSDKLNNIITWQGKLLYQELEGSASQKKKWEQRRQDLYYGSSLHFHRSLVNGNYDKEGFIMNILVRQPNPARAPEDLIQRKLDFFETRNRDSMQYWVNQYKMERYYNKLVRQPVRPEQVVSKTDVNGLYGLSFPACLYVIYTKRHETQEYKDIYRPLDMENFEVSVVTLYTPYVIFDSNGATLSGNSPLYEGAWSKNRIAELLPVDYVPSASHTPSYLK